MSLPKPTGCAEVSSGRVADQSPHPLELLFSARNRSRLRSVVVATDPPSGPRLERREDEFAEEFRVEGLYVDDGMRVVIYGEMTSRSLPKLQAILDGLLLLRPAALTVEFDRVADPNLVSFIGKGHYASVRAKVREMATTPVSPSRSGATLGSSI